MAKNTVVQTTLQIHSQAKLDFYETYLSRYLMILCNAKFKRINIYDVFCGMGIYDDKGKGSPIIAFDLIKDMVSNVKFSGTNTRISLIVNDKEQQRVERVKKHIDAHNQNYCDVTYCNYDIGQMFDLVLEEVSDTPADTRNLIFIDPYGYKDIKKETLYQLMKNKKTEIILFLPISHMHRFTQTAIRDEERAQYKPLQNFVSSFFSSDHKMRNKQLDVMEYIQFITEALKYNEFYATSYYIKRDATNYFALFFISSNILGFEKILEVKWELDETSGRGFNIPSIQLGLFDKSFAEEEKNKNADRLESILLGLLVEPKTNRQIYEETLKNEFLPKHTVAIFNKWQSGAQNFKVYDIEAGKEARKRSFYLSHEYYNKKDKVQFRVEK